jgi:hypothetical protein
VCGAACRHRRSAQARAAHGVAAAVTAGGAVAAARSAASAAAGAAAGTAAGAVAEAGLGQKFYTSVWCRAQSQRAGAGAGLRRRVCSSSASWQCAASPRAATTAVAARAVLLQRRQRPYGMYGSYGMALRPLTV